MVKIGKFGKRLVNERRIYKKECGSRGLTQIECAKYLGVNLTTLRNWEHGRHKPLPIHRRMLKTKFPNL